ncbi:hypothetical protein C0995_005297, partial [Termitomyces sp. Mi166
REDVCKGSGYLFLKKNIWNILSNFGRTICILLLTIEKGTNRGDGILTQSGATRVWSSIPPYFWAIFGGRFLIYDEHYDDIPTHLRSQKTRLASVESLSRKDIPRLFISGQPGLKRPRPNFIEEKVKKAQPQKRSGS